MMPYEDISPIDHTKAVFSADKILTSGWVRRGYQCIKLQEAIPWHLRNPEERSWNYLIQAWDMLNTLLKAHSLSGNDCYLRPAITVALDWAVKHTDSVAEEVTPFAWYDMAVGMRAYRLAYLIDAGDEAGLFDVVTRQTLWNSLEQHQAYLADDTNIVFHNNHGFYQVAGQLAMGRRFAEHSQLMAQAKQQGTDRLLAMLKAQFSPDGIHREHSPDYHRMVYETLKAMLDSELVDDAETIAFAERIERALSWFVLPNRHIASFGDSDYRLMSRKAEETGRKWRTPPMQYVVSNGEIGILPTEDHVAFPDGGYFVARRAATAAPLDISRTSYLAQIAAFHSRTHKHADDLSFLWSDRGSDLLVDAGRYGYIGKSEQGSDLWREGFWYSDPNRVYCETTRAHNTLEFDGRNYQRKGAKPYGSALKRWTKTDNGVIAVETEVKQFGSIRHARVLVFQPGEWLLVFDWFHDNNGEFHNVKQWFHLSPNLELLLDQVGYMIPVPSSPEPLRVVSLLDGTFASRPYLAEEVPVMQGWWSPKEREIVPAYAFCLERNKLATGLFATLFSFSQQLTSETDQSRCNVSGRKAQFGWKDERGRHLLLLERPQDGSLTVEYTLN